MIYKAAGVCEKKGGIVEARWLSYVTMLHHLIITVAYWSRALLHGLRRAIGDHLREGERGHWDDTQGTVPQFEVDDGRASRSTVGYLGTGLMPDFMVTVVQSGITCVKENEDIGTILKVLAPMD
jgi:hypothetical protein